jgi:hypothetical protein
MLAYDFPVLGAFLTMFWFFLWVMWLFLLFRTIGDILRSEDLKGGTKVLWLLAVLVFPYLGVFAYVLARGDVMAYNDDKRRQRLEAAVRRHMAVPPTSPGDELTKLAGLRDSGVLSEAEFQQQKEKLLA